MYDAWKASDEWAAIEQFQQLRETEINAKITRFDMSDKDLCADIQKYLDGMWDLVQTLKVPGRKAKCKFIISL